MTRVWAGHLRDHPLPVGQIALGFRRWLDADSGEAPCATQAASWLDVKREYMALRPLLGRIYVSVTGVAEELGLAVDGRTINDDTHELVVRGQRVPLTPLEFGVLRHLSARTGKIVSRQELLRDVWGTTFGGGSNVADVVVRSLRGKLGDGAPCIQTVRGSGYRLTPDWQTL